MRRFVGALAASRLNAGSGHAGRVAAGRGSHRSGPHLQAPRTRRGDPRAAADASLPGRVALGVFRHAVERSRRTRRPGRR